MATFMVYELRSNFVASMKPVFAKSVRNGYENPTKIWSQVQNHRKLTEYNTSNVAPAESYKMSERNVFLLQPTNLKTYLKDRLSQVSVQWSYCLFWMMHTTLRLTQRYKSPIRVNKTP